MGNKLLAGFIITYNRPDVLSKTIEQLFAQTFPPEKLWIIDNSEGDETEEMINSLSTFPLQYERMGYNAGPAGAAAKGLELVGDAGFDWIYWGDDNDPPYSLDTFERLLNLKNVVQNIGVIGAVGQFFNSKKGVIDRVPSVILKGSSYLEVDYVAGNMSMLISGKVARKGITPSAELFFGFEELDFCLKVKSAGFKIVVDNQIFLFLRNYHKKTDVRRNQYLKKNNLNREYYSLRNLLYIADYNALNQMKFNLFLRWSMKSVWGFKYGWKYGSKNFKLITLAFYHYLKGIKGSTVSLGNKI